MNTQPDRRTYFLMLFYFFLIWFGVVMIFGFIMSVAASMGFSPEALTKEEAYKEGTNALYFKLMLASQSLFVFILPTFIFSAFIRDKFTRFYEMDVKPKLSLLLLTILIIISSFPLIMWVYDLNQSISLPADLEETMQTLEAQAESSYQAMLYMTTPFHLILTVIIAGVLPAIGEELIFRGALQKLIHKVSGNIHIAVIIAAILFSMMHVQFYGFFPRMLMGILFGYLFYWSRSLWVPIFAHFVFNTTQVLAGYFIGDTALEEAISGTSQWLALGIGTLILAASLYFYQKTTNNISPNGQLDGEGLD